MAVAASMDQQKVRHRAIVFAVDADIPTVATANFVLPVMRLFTDTLLLYNATNFAPHRRLRNRLP